MLKSRVTITTYNDTYAKISVCFPDREGLPRFNGGGNKTNNERELTDEEKMFNLLRSAKRAYQTALAKAKALRVDRMLTLTFARNVCVSSKREALECFARFTRLCRCKFGKFEYVATLETQKRGAIHFHLAVNRYYLVWELWELWKKAIIASGLAESVDKVGSVYINKRASQSKSGIARYVCKYIMKEHHLQSAEFSQLRYEHQKRYLVSKMSVTKQSFMSGVTSIHDTDYHLHREICDFLKEKADYAEKMIKIGKFSYAPLFILGVDWAFSELYIS